MEKTLIVSKKVKARNPILIEGLPGIGLVGKLAADHMIKELGCEKIGEVYSPHFPHQVIMLKNGMMRMLKNKFYLYRNPNKKGSDIVILVGDVQAMTPEAQYEVCDAILDYFAKMGGKTIYTLGGYGTGRMTDKPRVFGSVNRMALVPGLKKHGVLFGEVHGSIIGAAGLLLGLGKLRGMDGACLMGETHGGYVDAKSAQSVLEMLSKVLDVKVNLAKLELRAKESEKFMKRIEKETAKQKELAEGASGELSYIR